jgi:hypothetical protein
MPNAVRLFQRRPSETCTRSVRRLEAQPVIILFYIFLLGMDIACVHGGVCVCECACVHVRASSPGKWSEPIVSTIRSGLFFPRSSGRRAALNPILSNLGGITNVATKERQRFWQWGV